MKILKTTFLAAVLALAVFPALAQTSTLSPAASNRFVVVAVAPTVAASAAYAAGDAVGAAVELRNAVERAGAGGIVREVRLLDRTNAQGSIDVLFFAAEPASSVIVSNSALSLAAADLANVVGFAQIREYASGASSAVGRPSTERPFRFVVGAGTSLWAALVARAGMTLSPADGLTLRVVVERS